MHENGTFAFIDNIVNNDRMTEASTTERKPRKRLSRDARRAQLIDCATEAFAERGLGRAGHGQVAETAQVSVATVFHYFPSREALLDVVLDRIENFFTDLARRIHRGPGTIDERLVRHGLAFLEAAELHPDYIRVWLDWSTAIREHVWPRYLAFQENLVGIVAASIEEGQGRGEVAAAVNPDNAARLFVGNAHMAAVMKFAPDAGLDLEQHVRQAVTALLGRS